MLPYCCPTAPRFASSASQQRIPQNLNEQRPGGGIMCAVRAVLMGTDYLASVRWAYSSLDLGAGLALAPFFKGGLVGGRSDDVGDGGTIASAWPRTKWQNR